jgi:acetyltransferase-like isoleucine patch superfamily enzyme
MNDRELGEITGAWDLQDLPGNVRIGRGCWFERKASFGRFRSVRDPGLVFGDRVRVHTWTTFNVEPSGVIEVGSDAILVGPVFMCQEHIVVGARVVLSYNVTVADSDFHPVDPALRKQDAIANAPQGDRSLRPKVTARPVVIEDDVHVGIGAIILKGVRIGRGARIGPGAVVTSGVAPGTTVAGNPAVVVPPEGVG